MTATAMVPCGRSGACRRVCDGSFLPACWGLMIRPGLLMWCPPPPCFSFGRSGKRSVIGGVGSVKPDAPRLGVCAAGLTGSTEPICSQALAVRAEGKQVGGPSGRSFPRPVSGEGPATSPPLQGWARNGFPRCPCADQYAAGRRMAWQAFWATASAGRAWIGTLRPRAGRVSGPPSKGAGPGPVPCRVIPIRGSCGWCRSWR